MSADPIELLISKIIDQYNRKPEGWTVLTDKNGNVLVLGPKTGYRLKIIPINPLEFTGVGVEIDNLREIQRVAKGFPSYGFRSLSRTETIEMLNAGRKRDLQNRLINKLLGKKPIPTWQVYKENAKSVLSGPVIAHPNLSTISKSQMELEAKLVSEASKLFRKKYPRRAAIYG